MVMSMDQRRPAASPAIGPRRREHNIPDAVQHLRTFLEYRATRSPVLARERAETMDGAYPATSGPTDDAGHSPGYATSGPFTHAVHERVSGAELTAFPDWYWVGWEEELKALPAKQNETIRALHIDHIPLNTVLARMNCGYDTLQWRRSRGLFSMTVALLRKNAP